MSGTTNNSIGCTRMLCMFFEVLGTLLSCVLLMMNEPHCAVCF